MLNRVRAVIWHFQVRSRIFRHFTGCLSILSGRTRRLGVEHLLTYRKEAPFLFAHQPDERIFVDWIGQTFPAMQTIYFHFQSTMRHGLSILQSQKSLEDEDLPNFELNSSNS